MKCSICGKELTGKGNNPAPFQRSNCCDECNLNLVVPIRFYLSGVHNNQLLVLGSDNTVSFTEPMEEAKLKLLQNLVGGYITLYPSDLQGYLFIVDEEGMLKDLKPNQLAYELLGIEVVGNVVVCPKKLFK